MDSCKIEIYECPVLFSVVFFFFCLFRVPVSLIYHIYSALSTNEAKREKRYGIFRNFWFLEFLIIVVGSRRDCIGSSVYYSGLQKVE